MENGTRAKFLIFSSQGINKRRSSFVGLCGVDLPLFRRDELLARLVYFFNRHRRNRYRHTNGWSGGEFGQGLVDRRFFNLILFGKSRRPACSPLGPFVSTQLHKITEGHAIL